MTVHFDLVSYASDNAAIFAAILGSKATRWAAVIEAEATALAGCLTLAAGVLAFFGARIVLRNGDRDRAAANERRAQDERAALRRMAAVYLAELSGLWKFLDEHGVIDTLRARSAEGTRMDFTPGNSWLRTYSHDPTTIGVFSATLAESLAYTLTRSLNEIGRLAWLHKWNDPPNVAAQAQQQMHSANTLTTLRREAKEIEAQLNALAI